MPFAHQLGMTPTIRKILLTTDFSESSDRAVGYAATLAKSFGASLEWFTKGAVGETKQGVVKLGY
jgi:nucleotide-binding universal stress UspA family protein